VPVYLGFDASTQSLTAILIRIEGARREVVVERSFKYDDELPRYGTRNGVLRGDDPLVVVAPPLMWAEALDRMIASLAAAHPAEMAQLAAIAGSAQQHGSVYLNAEAAGRIQTLDARVPLASQLEGIFARVTSPTWMDSSTTVECREIEEAVGGAAALAQRTGSRAFERFTGPQIRRFFKQNPRGYDSTVRIHLISSFLATLLAGKDGPIDRSDGAGMCLQDLATSAWWPEAAAAVAPGLMARLPALEPSSAIAGTLSSYWRERYGLPASRVVAWSGDNGCSLVGTGLVREGRIGISLGTSDVVFGAMRDLRVSASGIGHVYGSPTGDFMGLTVFKNGSLARERVRDAYGLNWAKFSAALRSTPPGNGGSLMLPWFDPEITPHVSSPGVHRLNLAEIDVAGNVRAIVEAQMMAMANHSRWMGVKIETIHATGGASGNADVLQVMADVFGATVHRFASGHSACLGAALRAWHADALASGHPVEWDEVVADLAAPMPGWAIAPRPEYVAVYADLRERYSAFEKDHCGRT